MKTQEQLFNEIKQQANVVQELATFIQNDYEELLDDGIITKDKIKSDINEMEKLFNKHIKTIYELRNQCKKLMLEVSK